MGVRVQPLSLASGKKKILKKQLIVSSAVENLTHHPKVKGSILLLPLAAGDKKWPNAALW
jgi:hypothetical protein